jgi:diadenosine tetraphosphate (Ap4A) HIT family hydrolase
MVSACVFCAPPRPETVLWRDERCRVIDVANVDYPGYCQVVWTAHVKEMSDLAVTDRAHVMQIAYAVEEALRELINPDKINLAALGNQVPHLHWHVIPRFVDDPHFPDPIWGAPKRDAKMRMFDRDALPPAIERRIGATRT